MFTVYVIVVRYDHICEFITLKNSEIYKQIGIYAQKYDDQSYCYGVERLSTWENIK